MRPVWNGDRTGDDRAVCGTGRHLRARTGRAPGGQGRRTVGDHRTDLRRPRRYAQAGWACAGEPRRRAAREQTAFVAEWASQVSSRRRGRPRVLVGWPLAVGKPGTVWDLDRIDRRAQARRNRWRCPTDLVLDSTWSPYSFGAE